MRQAQQFEWLLNGSRARHSSLSERHLSLHYSRCILGTLPLLTAAEILSAIQILWKITHATLLYWSSSVVLNLFVYHNSRNTLASGCFRGFSEKKCLNARGFAWEYVRSCMGYTPGQSVKRCSKSSNLHSKKFLLAVCGFFCDWRHKWRTFRPPWPTLPGPGRQLLCGNILLKFLLETRLQSESFDTLDDLLGFWFKNYAVN